MKKAMKHMMSYAAPAAAPVEVRSKEEKAAPENQPFQTQAASVKAGTVTLDLKGLLRDGIRAKDEAFAREDFWRSYRAELTAVYRNYLARHPGVHGTLTIRLVIGADGRVRGAEIISSNLKHPAPEQVILELAKKWSFPVSGVKRDSVLTVPLILSL